MAETEHQNLTQTTTLAAGSILLVTLDPTGTPGSRYITFPDFMETIEDALSAIASGHAGTDTLLIIDGGVAKYTTIANLLAGIEDATSELATRPAQSDTFLVIDGGVAKYIQKRNLQVRYAALTIGATGTDLATGDRQAWFKVTADLAGLDLVSVEADVVTAPTGAALNIQVRNVTSAANMLSTAITIDATETSSDTAATPAVINTSEDDLTDGDIIAIDIDAVGSTEPGEDLLVTLGFA